MSLTREIKEEPESHGVLLNGLERTIVEMRNAEKSEERDTLVRLDYTFHKLILEEVGNSIVISIYETLKSFLYEEIRKSHLSADAFPHQAENHLRLLTAIKSGNPEIAAGAIKHHFRETADFVRDTMQKEKRE